MIMGILASSSALRMHSSKNSREETAQGTLQALMLATQGPGQPGPRDRLDTEGMILLRSVCTA